MTYWGWARSVWNYFYFLVKNYWHQPFNLLFAVLKFQTWYVVFTFSVPIDLSNQNLLVQSQQKKNRKKCEICSELIMKISERRQCLRSGVFNVNLEHISHLFLVFLMLNLNKKMLAGWSVKILLVTHVALSHANLYFEFILRLAARPRCFSANITLFSVKNRNHRKRCEVYSNLTTKAPEPRYLC